MNDDAPEVNSFLTNVTRLSPAHNYEERACMGSSLSRTLPPLLAISQ